MVIYAWGSFCAAKELLFSSQNQDIRVKGLLLIWHSTLWLIWKARNEFIFSAKVKTFLGNGSWLKKMGQPYLYYEWFVNPFDCTIR